MDYLIVSLLKGKTKEVHEKVRLEVAEKFNVPYATSKKAPSHISMKYLPDAKDINQIEKLLELFSKTQNKVELEVRGVSSFGKNVIFLEIKPSKEMLKMYILLVENLKKIKWIEWDEKTEGKNIHFHASIAHKDIPGEKFQDIFNFVKDKNIKLKTSLDNLAILKSEDNIWKVYKEFDFKS